ncbi:hypothetical protein K1719_039214 [Acacia pycnantha]|nr:hypothetical protein K1719_039214 [Acacia pycnantha]
MANYDLTPRIERQIYEDEHILKAKIGLLNKTNMVDYAMDIHKSLYHTEDVPQEMVDMRVEVVARFKAQEEVAAPLVSFLQNANAVQDFKADKQYNLQMLSERYQVLALCDHPAILDKSGMRFVQVVKNCWLKREKRL